MVCREECKPCLRKALYRLGRGDLTARGLLDYLTRPSPGKTGFPEEIAMEVTKLLIREGYLDDARFLSLVLEKADRSLVGPRKIREELKKKKFSPRAIEIAMSREIDFSARAKKLVLTLPSARLLSQTPQGRKKLCDTLVRKGFDYSDAFSALSVFQEPEE